MLSTYYLLLFRCSKYLYQTYNDMLGKHVNVLCVKNNIRSVLKMILLSNNVRLTRLTFKNIQHAISITSVVKDKRLINLYYYNELATNFSKGKRHLAHFSLALIRLIRR